MEVLGIESHQSSREGGGENILERTARNYVGIGTYKAPQHSILDSGIEKRESKLCGDWHTEPLNTRFSILELRIENPKVWGRDVVD